MTLKTSFRINYSFRFFRYCLLFTISILLIGACEKEPPPGSLFITTKYDGSSEDNVECLLYESLFKFQHFEYLQKDLSDELGDVLFEDLEAGWYIIEASKDKSSLFTIYAVDSVEITAGKRTNKILNLFPVE